MTLNCSGSRFLCHYISASFKASIHGVKTFTHQSMQEECNVFCQILQTIKNTFTQSDDFIWKLLSGALYKKKSTRTSLRNKFSLQRTNIVFTKQSASTCVSPANFVFRQLKKILSKHPGCAEQFAKKFTQSIQHYLTIYISSSTFWFTNCASVYVFSFGCSHFCNFRFLSTESLFLQLFHSVQSTASMEPLNLPFIQWMFQLNLICWAVFVFYLTGHHLQAEKNFIRLQTQIQDIFSLSRRTELYQ